MAVDQGVPVVWGSSDRECDVVRSEVSQLKWNFSEDVRKGRTKCSVRSCGLGSEIGELFSSTASEIVGRSVRRKCCKRSTADVQIEFAQVLVNSISRRRSGACYFARRVVCLNDMNAHVHSVQYIPWPGRLRVPQSTALSSRQSALSCPPSSVRSAARRRCDRGRR